MSAASRESKHAGDTDTDGESRAQSVIVPTCIAQRSTGLHSAEDVTELGGGGEHSTTSDRSQHDIS
jgi:hypothetical protein